MRSSKYVAMRLCGASESICKKVILNRNKDFWGNTTDQKIMLLPLALGAPDKCSFDECATASYEIASICVKQTKQCMTR